MKTRTLLMSTLGLAVAFGAVTQALADPSSIAPATAQAAASADPTTAMPQATPAPVKAGGAVKAPEAKVLRTRSDAKVGVKSAHRRMAERRLARHERRLAMKARHGSSRLAQAKVTRKDATVARPVG